MDDNVFVVVIPHAKRTVVHVASLPTISDKDMVGKYLFLFNPTIFTASCGMK